MFETIDDLPLHPLVVHAVVVLGPLAALMLVGYALVPRWRRGLRWPTLALSLAAAGAGVVAEESGEFFEHALRDRQWGGQVPDIVREHAEAGELAVYVLWGLFGAAVLVTLVLLRVGKEPLLGSVGRVLGVVVAVLALAGVGYAVYNAGDLGARAVWEGSVSSDG